MTGEQVQYGYEPQAFFLWVLTTAAIVGFAVLVHLRVKKANRTRFEAQVAQDERTKLAATAGRDAQVAANRAKIDHWEQRTPQQLEIAKSGTPATARIVAAKMTNRMYGVNPLVDLTLEVQGPGGPYPVQMQLVIPLINIPAFQRGATIDVRVDQKNRENLVFIL